MVKCRVILLSFICSFSISIPQLVLECLSCDTTAHITYCMRHPYRNISILRAEKQKNLLDLMEYDNVRTVRLCMEVRLRLWLWHAKHKFNFTSRFHFYFIFSSSGKLNARGLF